MSKHKTTVQTVRVVSVPAGEYVTAGDTYQVTRTPSNRKSTAHFWSPVRQCGTYMPDWQFRAAVASGAFVAA